MANEEVFKKGRNEKTAVDYLLKAMEFHRQNRLRFAYTFFKSYDQSLDKTCYFGPCKVVPWVQKVASY